MQSQINQNFGTVCQTFFALWFQDFFSIAFQNRQTQKNFSEIIMGSPLNSNVPEGSSVQQVVVTQI